MLDQPGQRQATPACAEAAPPPAWPGFRPLAVTGIDRESESVISVHLADPEGGSVPAALPGQFLTLRLHPDPTGGRCCAATRCRARRARRDYRISVKREEHGAGSQFVHTRGTGG